MTVRCSLALPNRCPRENPATRSGGETMGAERLNHSGRRAAAVLLLLLLRWLWAAAANAPCDLAAPASSSATPVSHARAAVLRQQ